MEPPLQGLSSEHAAKLLTEIGKNEILTKEKTTPLQILLSQFTTGINAILASAAILSFFISDIFDGLFIFAVLIVNGLLGFAQEYQAEKALEKLKNYSSPLSRVVRNGKEEQIPTENIVPGDIVVLSEGDLIPADGTLIVEHHMEMDEAILTGESLPLTKLHNDSAYKGTLITIGHGKMQVTQTGMQTRFGKIASTLETIEIDKTPLQKRLKSLTQLISLFSFIAAIGIIAIGISQGKAFFPVSLLAISVAIAAIPEGLPAVLTIALAIGTKRMAKQKAVVRKMPAVETLGAMQIILIDKTGTLTQNVMRVKKLWTASDHALSAIIKASLLGNTATLVEKENVTPEAMGDKTDGALLLWATIHKDRMHELYHDGTIVEEYPFDPNTRTITVIWKKTTERHVFVRGAAEELLEKSKISQKEKEAASHEIEMYAKEGLRVIGFATKVAPKENEISRETAEKDLTFLGIIGIYDPPRPQAAHAVQEAKNAGVQPIMVTGDNELTALAIAKEIGLIENDEEVITGDELDKLSDEQLRAIIQKIRVFARTKPEDKLRLVQAYKALGFVVGVTGDGVNDALALKQSDVGIAMGQTGTDVAKEASDIVLLDDNFTTLVAAIEEGRNIYHNLVKAITYLLSGNFALICLIMLVSLLGLPAPLLPTQILWINLIADGLPALALASDTKNPNLIKQSPRNPQAPILTKTLIFYIMIIGASISISLLITYMLLLNRQTVPVAQTSIFYLFIAFRLVIAFLVRGELIFSFNKMLVLSVVITILLQIMIAVVPIFQQTLGLAF